MRFRATPVAVFLRMAARMAALQGAVLLGAFQLEAHAETGLSLTPGQELAVAHPDQPLPVEKVAAEDLASYLSRAVGVKARVVAEAEAEKGGGAVAWVGACRSTKALAGFAGPFKSEGYRIALKDGALRIAGDDGPGDAFAADNRTGTLFGVYDFLENDVGIAWIWPGPTGEDVPKLERLELKTSSREDAPRLMYRGIKFSPAYNKHEPKELMAEFSKWFKRQRLSRVCKVWDGHSWDTYLFRDGVDQKHPEWLALWNGERKRPHCCTSNPEFREFIVEQCVNSPKNKGMSVVSISPSDGVGFCECAKCRALDPPGTDYSSGIPNLSNRHWDYANSIAREVKKRKPGLGVAMLGYTAYRDPPSNLDRVEDNLYLAMCFSLAYCVKPEEKAKFFKGLDAWKAKGIRMTGYEYWGMHYWLDLPYVFTREIADGMPRWHAAGLLGMHGEAQKDFATQGPNYWLAAHLMWNPEAPADKVMERFYRAFGPAAGPVREYYETFENSIAENRDRIADFSYLALINSWPEVFPPKTFARAGECLRKARETAKGKGAFEERVRIVGIGYDYAKNMVDLLAAYRRLGRAGVPLWCFGKQGALAEQAFWKMKEWPQMGFWEKRPDEPMPREEKVRLLERAWALGKERERILVENAGLPAVSLGMYRYMEERGYYPWHATVRAELEKEGLSDK
jgi:hypothetical protein